MQLRLTPIIPIPLKVNQLMQSLVNGMKDAGIEIRENFEDTARTWDNKPVFSPLSLDPTVTSDSITVESTTDNEIYGYVTKGTKSHPIFPKNAKKLAFSDRFIPKTFPGIIGSSSGFEGNINQFRDWVAHPGIEARNFDKEIASRQKNSTKIHMENAMKIAQKASGHAYP